jgi:hypothetical protein
MKTLGRYWFEIVELPTPKGGAAGQRSDVK